jgi:NitT/TauT family transport system permease protein
MILITAVSVVIFGSILTIYTGFIETDPDKIMLIETLHGSKRHMLRHVVIPESVPLLFGVMKSNIGLCLVGVIIAEFMGARMGLGYLIIYSSQVFKLDWVLMAIVLLCLIAMGLYWVIGKLEKRILS